MKSPFKTVRAMLEHARRLRDGVLVNEQPQRRDVPSVALPSTACLWRVTFETINRLEGRAERQALELEFPADRPGTRRDAEAAVRKAVRRSITRFVEFHRVR